MGEETGGGVSMGWTRGCVNIRLTKERCAKLRVVAADASPGASPTDAFDLALDIAVGARTTEAGPEFASEGIDTVHEAVAKLSELSDANARAHGSALANLAGELRGLSELISAVAATTGGAGGGFDEPVSLRAWLEAQARTSPGAPISARARWQSKTHEGAGRIGLELMLRRTASPGERRAADGRPSIVKLTQLDAASPFARTDLIADFVLECRRSSDGSWRAAGFQIMPDGVPGPLLGTLQI